LSRAEREGPTSYETKLKTSKAFHDALENLEVDSGIRTHGTVKGKKSFIFITRHSGRYFLWLRPVDAKGNPGTFRDFGQFSELRRFLDPIVEAPIRASLY